MILQIYALATVILAASTTSAQETPSDFGIFQWIHESPGGYFNPKQEFRYATPGDSSTIAGVFATEDIGKGEILVQVPWDRVLKSDDPDEEGQMCCGTVRALAREMKLGAESEFAPYVEYLNAQPDGQIPSTWSEPARSLLRDIVGGTDVVDTEIPPSEPTEWIEWDWFKNCNADKTDQVAAKAAALVVQRSDDSIMIPAYDMYNHRNGKRWMNTKTEIDRGEKHVTRATRDIKAGEQIYISYNHCEECQARDSEYGTGEIFRDYGFIEPYPQEWWFGDYQFTIDEDPKNDQLVLEWLEDMKPSEDDVERFSVFLKRQFLRLRRVRNLSKYDPDNQKIPENEIESSWAFLEAYANAINMATEALEKEFGTKEGTSPPKANDNDDEGSEETCSNDAVTVNGSHYDRLDAEYDDLTYNTACCDNDAIMDWGDFDNIETLKTNYQGLNFAINREDGDLCMDIEDIIQICTSYRPQYHEYVVHAAARFVDSVKRVIFIGGGDSMILHEVLLYPDLELVVGLELDQMVVRKAFKHFKTQPHFDDDRVEWWFGDATKSLLLLEKEYWQSFDLVLIDLSETVMSLSVTDELDVFDALRLLLKPDGVMVKNEKYFNKMSELFDYTTQIYYESPIICTQTLAMGSNSANFFLDMPKDHGVETLLYENLTKKDNHLDYLHDFRRNDARAQGKCGDLKIPIPPTKQEKAAGITYIVNAENTTVPLDDGAKVAESIRVAIDKLGFSFLSDPLVSNGSVYGVMKEGYIVARLFPSKKYCAFDINLWGRFDQLKRLQKTLTEAVGSTDVSSYRVVVGGMFGSSSWAEDEAMIGPQVVQPRSCEDPAIPTDSTLSTEEIIQVALEESMTMSTKSKMKSVVFCGVEEKGGCLAADLLREHESVKSVDQVFTCEGLDDEEVSDEDMQKCEYDTLSKLLPLVSSAAKSRFDLLVVDSSVPYPMIQVLHSMLGNVRDRLALIKHRNLFIVVSANPEDEVWRTEFLDRYRKQYELDPVTHGQLVFKSGKTSVGFGVVSGGNEEFVYSLEEFTNKVQSTFDDMGKEIVVDLRSVLGGDFPWLDEWDPPRFSQSDYNLEPGNKQYAEQEFLGRQNIFQLVPAENVDNIDMSNAKLKETLERGLELMKLKVLSHHEFTDVGEGCVQVFVCEEGSAIGIWDGRNHVDINLFTYEEMKRGPKDFIAEVIEFSGKVMMMALRDDQPRGVGRVINFPGDMTGGGMLKKTEE